MKTTYKNFTITGKLKAQGVNFPNSKNRLRHNQYLISVKNTETNKRISFDFYDSNKNYTDGIIVISDSDLLHAFYCFVSDAVAGESTQEDFINEFGYDYFNGRKIHRLCQKSLEKFEKIYSGDIYDFLNELQDDTNN